MPKPKELVKMRWRTARDGWELDYWEPDPTTQHLKRYRPLFVTEGAALAAKVEILARLEAKAPRPMDYDIQLRDFVAEWKREEASRTDTRTFEDRVAQLDRRVLPALGVVKVRELTAGHVLDLLGQLRGRGLSKNSIRLAKDALSIVCGLAVIRGILKTGNPCLKLGVYGKLGGKRPKEPNPMTEVQLAAFETVMAERQGRTFPMLFRVMADTGLRPGEARGLQVEDIDWVTGTLHVIRALRKDGGVKDTKTEETRNVELSPELLRDLREYVAWRAKRSLAQGWGEPLWLFVTTDNAVVDQRTMRRSFKTACKRAGLRGFRPYDLRATCATHLLQLSGDVGYVAEQLGNSPMVIWKHYAKYLPSRSPAVGGPVGGRATIRDAGVCLRSSRPGCWNQNLEPRAENGGPPGRRRCGRD